VVRSAGHTLADTACSALQRSSAPLRRRVGFQRGRRRRRAVAAVDDGPPRMTLRCVGSAAYAQRRVPRTGGGRAGWRPSGRHHGWGAHGCGARGGAMGGTRRRARARAATPMRAVAGVGTAPLPSVPAARPAVPPAGRRRRRRRRPPLCHAPLWHAARRVCRRAGGAAGGASPTHQARWAAWGDARASARRTIKKKKKRAMVERRAPHRAPCGARASILFRRRARAVVVSHGSVRRKGRAPRQ